MISTTGLNDTIAFPEGYKYRDVFLKGRPQHDRFDSFSIRHPKMALGKRAKIFAPFAALRGYDEEIASKEVQHVPKIELSCEDETELNRRLDLLHTLTYNSRLARQNQVRISVTAFVPCKDTHHPAYGTLGQYQTITGTCRYVDPYVNRVLRVDNSTIPFDSICAVESPDHIFA